MLITGPAYIKRSELNPDKVPPGHWVACTGDLPICSGTDLEAVVQRANELGCSKPFVYKQWDCIVEY